MSACVRMECISIFRAHCSGSFIIAKCNEYSAFVLSLDEKTTVQRWSVWEKLLKRFKDIVRSADKRIEFINATLRAPVSKFSVHPTLIVSVYAIRVSVIEIHVLRGNAMLIFCLSVMRKHFQMAHANVPRGPRSSFHGCKISG